MTNQFSQSKAPLKSNPSAGKAMSPGTESNSGLSETKSEGLTGNAPDADQAESTSTNDIDNLPPPPPPPNILPPGPPPNILPARDD